MSKIGILKKLFSTEYMVKPEDRLGDLPRSGEAYSTFIKLAWPAMIESLFVAMASFIDGLMVSRASDTAVAAVGVTNQPRMLFYILFFAISASTVAVVSRRYGENSKEAASRCAAQNLTISVIVAVIECIIAFSIARPLLFFSGAQYDTIDDATVYFQISVIGMFFYSFSCVLNAAQRGTGRTKITMRSSLAGNILNVILNAFLINGLWFFPKLGVKGAAIATLCGNICSFLISLFSYFGKSSYLKLRFSYFFKFERDTLNTLLHVGSGAGVEQIFMRVGMFMFAKVVADLGTEAMTTHQICMNIINLSFACGDGLSAASAAIVGQNLGRGRGDISLMYGKLAQRIAWGFSAILFAFFILCGEFLMRLFSTDETVISEGINILIIVAFVSLAQVSQIIFTGSLRGAGDTKFNAVVSFFSIDIVRPTLAFVLCHVFKVGVIGAWFALMLDQYTRFICVTVHFYRGKWRSIKL
ncbi:MAG: MATE family efflux transporter [Ruminococcaceae bacterium]|nr:MATE family efflux transporter [Oscillospiraceae bacterium]